MCIWRRPACAWCAAGSACRASCSARATSASKGASAQEALKAALADPSALMVNRNAGAGTRVLIDKLLAGARPPGYANQPKSHNAVAAAIAQSRADWGVAIEPVAKLYGLGFLPLAPEHYDFLLVESRAERPAVQAFLAALRDDESARAHPRARHEPVRNEPLVQTSCCVVLLLPLALARRRTRNCAAMAGRCARWRSRPTAATPSPAASTPRRSAGRLRATSPSR